MSHGLIKPPIFVVGCARSGTTLLKSLFDGHSETLVFPIEMKFFRFARFQTFFNFTDGERFGPQEIAAEIADSHYFDYLKGCDPKDFSYQVFRRYLLHVSEETTSYADAFLSLFAALMTGLGRDPGEIDDVRCVEKTPFQEEYAVLLKTWFPTARFVHIIRNPYAILCSLRGAAKWWGGAQVPRLRRHLQNMKTSFRFLMWNQEVMTDYFTVRYEDLVLDTEGVMRELCRRIDLTFEEALLRSSRLGSSYSGHSSFRDERDTTWGYVRKQPADRWKREITDLEISLVNKHLGGFVSALGYTRIEPGSLLKQLIPQKGEKPKAYVGNRLLLIEGPL